MNECPLSNIVQASISSHAIFHLLLICKIQHQSKNWLEQPWDNPMKCGDPDWAGMRADSHSPDRNFSLQNPPQLYDLHHDVIPPQPTDSQNPHSSPTRTQNDLQTPLKRPFFKYKAVWVLFTDISHQLRGGDRTSADRSIFGKGRFVGKKTRVVIIIGLI